MLGPMFIEIESFSESKQASGYGVVLQIDLMEDKWASTEVFAEENELF